MPYRFPPIPVNELTSEQKEGQKLLDHATSVSFGENGSIFIFKDDAGAYVGPFAVLLRTPSLIKPYFELARSIGAIEGMTPKIRELAILATGSVYKSAYELYAHSLVAESEKVGLSHAQVEDARSGKTPSGLSQQEAVAYDIALSLAKTPGDLDQESFHKAGKELGEQGRLALTHFVGLYAYTCVLLNLGAVPAEGPY